MRMSRCMLLLVLNLLLYASALQAETVLERVTKGGKFVIAHRESSIPFSYLDANKKPVGYALDLCLKLAVAVQKKVGKNIPIEYLMVTSANRINIIETNKADLECGSTTNNLERREKVSFTIPHFITGARLLVRADSKIERIEDLNGKILGQNYITCLIGKIKKRFLFEEIIKQF